jgi:hypothetical protein
VIETAEASHETLVALVAEECAKVCDSLSASATTKQDRWVAFVCAEAIRAKFPLPPT